MAGIHQSSSGFIGKGVSVATTAGRQKLFQPGCIGEMTFKNRIAMPPMGTNLASEDGQVTDRLPPQSFVQVEHCNWTSSWGLVSLPYSGQPAAHRRLATLGAPSVSLLTTALGMKSASWRVEMGNPS